MNYKKILAGLLIVALCLSTIPVSIFAENQTPAMETVTEEAALTAGQSAQTDEEASAEPESKAEVGNETEVLPDAVPTVEDKAQEAAAEATETKDEAAEDAAAPSALPTPTTADGETQDGFKYEIRQTGPDDQKIAVITGYTGKGGSITIPGKIEGYTVEVGDNAFAANAAITSVTVDEGVQRIGNNAFASCSQLSSIELPSTLTYLGYSAIRGCALTNTDGFKKAVNLGSDEAMSYLDLSNNQIVDLNGLKGLKSLKRIDLYNNPNLSDVTPLKGMDNITWLDFRGTRVSDQSKFDLIRCEDLQFYVTQTKIMFVEPTIVNMMHSGGNKIDSDVTLEDSALADVEKEISGFTLRPKKAGVTTATLKWKDYTKTFKVTIEGIEPNQPVDKPVTDLPDPILYQTPDQAMGLGVIDGDLYSLSGDKPEKLLENVRDFKANNTVIYENHNAYQKGVSMLFARDQSDNLWVRRDAAGAAGKLENKVAGTTKYVSNTVYYKDPGTQLHSGDCNYGYALTGGGVLKHIGVDGAVNDMASDVQDFSVTNNRGAVMTVSVLKKDGTYLAKRDEQVWDKGPFTEISKDVTALGEDNIYYTKDGGCHRVVLNADGENPVTIMEYGTDVKAIYGNYVVKNDGTTWYHQRAAGATPALIFKVLDSEIVTAPWPVVTYPPEDPRPREKNIFLDQNGDMWSIAYDGQGHGFTGNEKVEKIDSGVLKYRGALKGDYAHFYLKKDGTLKNLDGQVLDTGVRDCAGPYFLKDGQVLNQNGFDILSDVVSITSGSSRSEPYRIEITGGIYATRTDGSVWYVSDIQPVPQKVSGYPDIKDPEPTPEPTPEPGYKQEIEVNGTKVTIEAAAGVVPEGAQIKINQSIPAEIADGMANAIQNNETLGENTKVLQLLDISLIKDNVKIQPNGKVTVKIKLPENLANLKNLAVVYYNEADQSLQILDTKIENGYAVFETDHFSYYALVQAEKEQSTTNVTGNGYTEPQSSGGGTETQTAAKKAGSVSTGIITDTHTSAYLCAGMLVLAAAGLMAFRKRRNAR